MVGLNEYVLGRLDEEGGTSNDGDAAETELKCGSCGISTPVVADEASCQLCAVSLNAPKNVRSL